MNKLFTILLGVGAAAILLTINGWAIMVVWNWYMPEIFESLPNLRLGEAIGLSLVATLLKGVSTTDNEQEIDEMIVIYLVIVAFVLFFGYVVQAMTF